MYSYRPVETKNFRMQFGFGASFVQKRIDWTQFTFSDQLDEVFGPINSTSFVAPYGNQVMYPDFNAGITMRFNSGRVEASGGKMTTTIGASFHHMTQPRDAFINDNGRLPMRMVIHLNTNILSYNGVIYAPGFLYEKQSVLTTFQAGLNLYKNPIYAGFWFRNRSYNMGMKNYDSFIVNLGLNMHTSRSRRIKICYSFDYTMSRLKTASMGTHEVSMIFELDDVVTFKSIEQRSRKKQQTKFKECVEF
jgi:type IX secretion system PorP/SprF family membrane protein